MYVTAYKGDALSVYDVASDGSLSNPRIYRDDKTYKLPIVAVPGAIVSVVVVEMIYKALHRAKPQSAID
ncbi:hypothetical protein [Endozoicomonas numazuensis]|uniref:hypothetical protein n=1 Tax=Endozoicomonas numazuensis TaxID=1137799 RepID=UPI0012698049|nr:hypothetical protein [Endozoicomonas numazuensis]